MSWIFGKIGNIATKDLSYFNSIHDPSIHLYKNERIYIAAGGLRETCLSNLDENSSECKNSGWIACGLGITINDSGNKLMTQTDWNAILSENNTDFKNINGHFVIAKWDGKQVSIYTDQLGLRNIYLTTFNNSTYFSTRMDWLAQARGDCNINYEEFGSRWLLCNQLSTNSILTNITRVAPGGVVSCTPNNFTIKETAWSPDSIDVTSKPVLPAILDRLATFPMNNGYRLNLSLSGGLDSRVLLSLLINNENTNWCAYTFGNTQCPDVRIAKKIAVDFGFELEYYNDPLPSTDQFLAGFRSYIGQTSVTAPASMYLNLRYNLLSYKHNTVLSDGGFGEIVRRRYLNRLMIRGTEAVQAGDIKSVYPHLKVHRAAVFGPDINHRMSSGALKQLQHVWETMPTVKRYGIGNWLDLFAIRTRLPNFLGPEQTRLDGEVINYMPYAQPVFLNSVFLVPIALRNNGGLLRSLLNQNSRKLSRYPLAKDDITYPFGSTVMESWIWTKFKHALGLNYSDGKRILFLDSLSEYIQDIADSTIVRTAGCYDYPAVKKIIRQYYCGNKQLAGELDWWLSFELWRQVVHGK